MCLGRRPAGQTRGWPGALEEALEWQKSPRRNPGRSSPRGRSSGALAPWSPGALELWRAYPSSCISATVCALCGSLRYLVQIQARSCTTVPEPVLSCPVLSSHVLSCPGPSAQKHCPPPWPLSLSPDCHRPTADQSTTFRRFILDAGIPPTAALASAASSMSPVTSLSRQDAAVQICTGAQPASTVSHVTFYHMTRGPGYFGRYILLSSYPPPWHHQSVRQPAHSRISPRFTSTSTCLHYLQLCPCFCRLVHILPSQPKVLLHPHPCHLHRLLVLDCRRDCNFLTHLAVSCILNQLPQYAPQSLAATRLRYHSFTLDHAPQTRHGPYLLPHQTLHFFEQLFIRYRRVRVLLRRKRDKGERELTLQLVWNPYHGCFSNLRV